MTTHHSAAGEARRIVRAGRAMMWIGAVLVAVGILLHLLNPSALVGILIRWGVALGLAGLALRVIEPIGYRRDGTRFDRTRRED